TLKQSSDAPQDATSETPMSHINKEMKQNETSNETNTRHPNDAPQNKSIAHYETSQKEPKKRGLFGRVLNAVFNED
ncbi:MAG: DNA-binding protein, partial [Bacilli bacterium]